MPTSEEQPDIIDEYFESTITDRERACFEAGIKLGAIFHSILGFPVQNDHNAIQAIQEGFIASFKAQPYVEDLDVKIELNSGERYKKRHEFDYTIVKDYMIRVVLNLKYKEVQLDARIEWIPGLDYPLMYVKTIA
jgi:dihydroneopterin aldolase